MPSSSPLAVIVAEYIHAYNAFDLVTLAGLFHEDARLMHHNRGIDAHGLDEILAQYRHTYALMPDRRFLEPRTITVAENSAFVAHRFTALPLAGASATPIQLDLFTVFRFRGARISEYHDYG